MKLFHNHVIKKHTKKTKTKNTDTNTSKYKKKESLQKFENLTN